MNKKLYVGNLSYGTTEDELRELFSEVGPTESVSLIIDRATGKSKGFGFVEMETVAAAEEAIERFNGTEFNGRNLTVSEARPPAQKSYSGSSSYQNDRGSSQNRGGGGYSRDSRGGSGSRDSRGGGYSRDSRGGSRDSRDSRDSDRRRY